MSDIEKYIGNTPLVLICEVGSNKIYGKLEGNNPAGSIKDRPAIRMIKDAENKGLIKVFIFFYLKMAIQRTNSTDNIILNHGVHVFEYLKQIAHFIYEFG